MQVFQIARIALACALVLGAGCQVEYCEDALHAQQVCEDRNVPGDSEHSRARCPALPGCSWGEGCGLPACEGQHDVADCQALPYCAWSQFDTRCFFSGVCRESIGICSDPSAFSATACTSFAVDQCAAKSGCELSERCIGTPLACEEIDSRDSCKAHPNCRWESHPAPRVH